MELLNFNQLAYVLLRMFIKNERTAVLWAVPVGAALWIALFALQGVGLFVMAKRLGMKKKALAFIPFANIYYMGKLAGECGFFGHKMKRAWLYAMIFQILSTLFTVAYIASELFLYHEYGVPSYPDSGDTLFMNPQWANLSGFATTVYKFYINGQSLMSIITLITQILMIILVAGIYKTYAPRNYRVFTVFTFIIPMSRFIFLFVIRGNDRINYEEYMRKQHEAYIRRQQQYYNTYGNPYNNPYGGYNNPYGAPQRESKPPEEPFGEFGSDEPFEELSEDKQKEENSDGFFD